MRHKILSMPVLALAFVCVATVTMAQNPQVIHFQGILVDSDGSPLRTDFYNVNFSIWEHATNAIEPLWAETQTVEVTDGLFDVFLGSSNPLAADVFNDDDDDGTYLQVQVEGDEPMTPRMQMGKTPNSFISARMLGDIETAEGSILLRNADGDSGISIISNEMVNALMVNWAEPLDVPLPAIEMAVDNSSGAANFKLTQPLDIPAPAIEMNASNELNSILINWTQPLDIPSPAIEMMTNGVNNSFAINWTQPLDMPSPAIKMNADDVINSFIMNWTQPLDMPSPAIEMTTAPTTGATYRMFQPQPEPPCISLLEMNTHSAGANFAMAAPSYGGLRTDIETPIIEMATGIESGGSIRMFQPQPEPPGSDPIIEMLVGASGGNFMMYGQQAMRESLPFFVINSYSSGADMKFFNPAGETTVNINSDGDVIAGRGSFGQNNTNSGTAGLVSGGNNAIYGSFSAIPGGYGNTVGSAADYSCLVGVDATLTADSTFMVDMPHIHFGDETSGYEFPTSDGERNQILMTDGSGQLSWTSLSSVADAEMSELLEIIEQQNIKIEELNNKIAELERRIK